MYLASLEVTKAKWPIGSFSPPTAESRGLIRQRRAHPFAPVSYLTAGRDLSGLVAFQPCSAADEETDIPRG